MLMARLLHLHSLCVFGTRDALAEQHYKYTEPTQKSSRREENATIATTSTRAMKIHRKRTTVFFCC